jgi:serine/threonine protein kinase
VIPAAEDDALIGRVIAGKFAIARRLGAGAMGAVYLAEQTALERSVAIKVMHGGFAADPTYAARFHLEAKAASRLDHPNLIRVLDYGQEPDGLLYIAMEYLEGCDLFALLGEEWPLAHERIVDLLSQTLSGLAEAHEAGVLHRDLKPENILIVRRKGDEGRIVELVKVGDFGIAKIVEPADGPMRGEGRKLTTAGLVVGTPEYMSPEQARGESFDARSDVYAVGVILYQLLTRRLPFQGKSSIEVVFKAMNEEPAKLGSDGLTAAPGLDPICLKAMSKRPEDRYQSAREMRAALRAAPQIATTRKADAESGALLSHQSTELELAHPAKPSNGTSTGISRGALVVGALVVAGLAAATIAMRRTPPTIAAAASLASAPDPSAVQAPAHDEPSPAATAPESAPAESPSGATPMTAARSKGAGYRTVHGGHSRAAASAAPPVEAPADPVAPVAVPPSTPVSAAPPTTAVAPPPPTPPPVATSPFDPATARVDLGQARSNNAAAASSSVSRALAPLASRFTFCFRTAISQAPALAAREAVSTLHLESDDEGYVTVAQVSGAPLPGAARCIEALSHSVHIQVDTGTANADVTLTFEP